MSVESLDVVVPEDLKSFVTRVLEKRLEEKQKEQQVIFTEKRKRVEKEINSLQEGLSYAKKIFEWAKVFRSNFDCLVLIGVGVKYRHRDGIFIFKEKLRGKGSLGLGISYDGLWWISFGCMAREYYVETPEKLAIEVSPEILKRVCEDIESGKIWDNIKENWTD